MTINNDVLHMKNSNDLQAILISINDGNVSKITCNYEFPTHKENSRLGDLNCTELDEVRKTLPFKYNKQSK